ASEQPAEYKGRGPDLLQVRVWRSLIPESGVAMESRPDYVLMDGCSLSNLIEMAYGALPHNIKGIPARRDYRLGFEITGSHAAADRFRMLNDAASAALGYRVTSELVNEEVLELSGSINPHLPRSATYPPNTRNAPRGFELDGV